MDVHEVKAVMAQPAHERRSVVRQAAAELSLTLQLRQIELLEELVKLGRAQAPSVTTSEAPPTARRAVRRSRR